MARLERGLPPGSVLKEWFADSQFFNAQDHPVRADRRDRARIRADQANSGVDRIRPAHRGPADILRVRAWEEDPEVRLHQREGRHVREDLRAVPVSLISRGKKKAR
jgi:hypothetical protein